MTKNRLSFTHAIALLAPAVWCHAVWPAAAHAGSETALAASETTSTPPEQSPRLPPGAVNLPHAGQLSTLFRIDDNDPESNVPTSKQRDSNPLEFGYYLQDLAARATAASQRQDQQAVIRYYRALAAAVPNMAQGWSLLCEAYEKVNDRQRALGACRYAIDREGAQISDFTRFVHLMVAKQGDLTADERTELNEVLAHLDKQADIAILAAHLRCESAVKMKDEPAMRACTAVLAKAAPDDPKTIVFQWSHAVMRGERDEAARLLSRAEKAGIAPENIAAMNQLAPNRLSSRVLGVLALGGALILLTVLVVRRRLAPGRA